jgi:hypothetical protein
MLLVAKIDAAGCESAVDAAGYIDRCCCVKIQVLPVVETDADGFRDRCCWCRDRCCWVQRQMLGKMLLVVAIAAAGCGNCWVYIHYTDRYCCVQRQMLPDVETGAAGCRDRCREKMLLGVDCRNIWC